MAPYVNDSDLKKLLTCDDLVVFCCTAPWSGPCKKIAPLIDQLAGEYEDRVKVVKIDVDKNKENAKKYNVKTVPSVLIVQQGELVEHITGVVPYENFSGALERYL